MRLVDFFIEPLLITNRLKQNPEQLDDNWEDIRTQLVEKLVDSKMAAVRSGFTESVCDSAMFPVVAYIDETVLTSKWGNRSQWQMRSLQREFYETSNAGHQFYERLGLLNRQGDDRSVREVFLLCMNLGFKGRYYSPQDRPKIEEIKVFNLNLLLPKDANNVFEKSTLFSDAYHERDQVNTQKQSRINLIPFFAFTPFVIVAASLIFYSFQINQGISSIMDVVK